jgi:hypothetical protein
MTIAYKIHKNFALYQRKKSFLFHLCVFLSTVCVIELILGLDGSLITINSIPIRYLLLFTNLFVFMVYIIINKKLSIITRRSIFIFFVCGVGIIWTFLGLTQNQSIDVLRDGKSYAFIILLLPITCIFQDSAVSVKYLLFVVMIPILALFTFSIGIFAFSVITNQNAFFIASNLGLSSDVFLSSGEGVGRSWFVTSFFFTLGLFLFALRAKDYSFFKFYFFLLFFSASIIATGSRSLLLSYFLLMPIAFFTKVKKGRSRLAFAFLSLILISSLSFLFFENISMLFQSSRFSTSSLSIAENQSDNLRISQYDVLINEFLKNPLIGFGFGHSVAGFTRSEISPYSYELFFLALVMKIGIIGMAFIFFSFGLALFPYFYYYKLTNHERITLAFFYLIVIIQASVNPFLDTQSGQFLLVFPLVYFQKCYVNQIKES